MSTIKHPVGPQPSKVYWHRRLIVILGLLAVIVVIVLIVVRPGASSGQTTPPPATTSKPPAVKTTPGATSPPSTTIPTTAAQVAGAPCVAANIDVEAIMDATNYSAAQKPQLSLSLTNTGLKSCTLDAGTATQVYTITSGAEVYWKSTDCQTNPVHTEILLKPAKTVTSTPIAWDRTRSDPASCSSTSRPVVPAAGASYHLKVSVGGFASATTKQFLLN